MNGYRLAVVGALVVVGLALASIGAAAVVDSSVDDPADEADDETPGMGSEVGTFMQSSSADANVSVDQGMFEAAFEGAEDREAVVNDRVGELEGRFDRLQERTNHFADRGDERPPGHQEQLTRMAVELGLFEESVNQTEQRAEAVGVDTARLDELRQNASEVSGPDVAEIARSIAGVDPPGQHEDGSPGEQDGGPPDHADPPNEKDDD
ncbi:hypothetical protein [Halovivax sp.]|uniref:hypothetical protein n=1 Tax=Halovivax sp. TaxID=1935978 RepID=UPI0025BB8829|nr:hypothetical protein [Halovivax sp.]